MAAYYNEHDRFACDWLQNLMDAGQITAGKIDDRSIVDVRPDDLAGYERVHFFAGIGGWDHALNLAKWRRPVWTGSCPCQPFSQAGRRAGFDDERHLWPVLRDLIAERRPATFFGEQVASAADWLRLVRSDLEAMGYAVGAIPFQAASAGADHLRDRYGFVADADYAGLQGRIVLPERADQWAVGADGVADATSERGDGCEASAGSSGRHVAEGDGCDVGFADDDGREARREAAQATRHRNTADTASGSDFEWVVGADGKARRVKSGVRLLVDAFPNRVGLLRGFGNAIDPEAFAQFIAAASEAMTPRVSSEDGVGR